MTRVALAGATPARVAPTPTVNPSGTVRLKPGALLAMVTDHLASHPGESHTAGQICAALGRSSGAVANALNHLATTGEVVRTSDKPKRYPAN